MVGTVLPDRLPSCFRQQPQLQRPAARQVTVRLTADMAQYAEADTPASASSSQARGGVPVAFPVGAGSEAEEAGAVPRRANRRRRRCATTPAVAPPGQVAATAAAAREGDALRHRRRGARCSTAPAAVLRLPTQWADENACNALSELVLHGRRGAPADEGASATCAAPALCAQLIADFLRFETPLPNMLYVIGGRNQSSSALATVEMFDTWHGHWVPCEPLPTPRVSATAAALPDGRLLVAGGYDERGMVEGLLATCEAYNPRTRGWERGSVAPMRRARWGHGCAALGGKVYVVGGCSLAVHAAPAVTSMETLASCEVYCPELDRWSHCAPLQVARSGSRAVAVGQRYLVAVGGCDDIFGREEHLRSVEIYDPAVGVWALLAQQLRQPRPIAAVTSLCCGGHGEEGLLLVVGGAAAMSSAEVYRVVPPREAPAAGAVGALGGQEEVVAEVDFNGERSEAVSACLPYAGGISDVPEGRMGCQAATLLLPRRGGQTYPSANSPSAVIIGGEVWESGRNGVPKRADFSSIPVFDIKAGTWRADPVVPAMPTARTAVALCVGEGYAQRLLTA